jgi:hypothetical protein
MYMLLSGTCLFFAHLLCCAKGYIAGYAPLCVPCRQTKILRNLGNFFSSIRPGPIESLDERPENNGAVGPVSVD